MFINILVIDLINNKKMLHPKFFNKSLLLVSILIVCSTISTCDKQLEIISEDKSRDFQSDSMIANNVKAVTLIDSVSYIIGYLNGEQYKSLRFADVELEAYLAGFTDGQNRFPNKVAMLKISELDKCTEYETVRKCLDNIEMGLIRTKGNNGIDDYDAEIDDYNAQIKLQNFISNHKLMHGSLGGLSPYIDHNPKNGRFSYYAIICYGESSIQCTNTNIYFTSVNKGKNWSIGF